MFKFQKLGKCIDKVIGNPSKLAFFGTKTFGRLGVNTKTTAGATLKAAGCNPAGIFLQKHSYLIVYVSESIHLKNMFHLTNMGRTGCTHMDILENPS